jgi:putative oxidoreductase
VSQDWEMKSLFNGILKTRAGSAALLIRLLVGAVFASEGVQKFLYPAALGVGRFSKIGLPAPQQLAWIVASFEIVCGLLILLGLVTRLAAIPLLVIISVAIATTKVPLFLHQGFWAGAHEARADWCMLLGSLFLIIVGGGKLSLDNKFFDE